MHAGRAAREEDDDGAEEVEDGRGEDGPAGDAKGSRGVGVGVVDGVAQDGEGHKVGDEHDEGQEEGEHGDQGGQEGAHDARAQRQQECDEGRAGGHGVQDHDARQGVGGVGGLLADLEVGVDAVEDVSGAVADVAGRAVVILAVWLSVSS